MSQYINMAIIVGGLSAVGVVVFLIWRYGRSEAARGRAEVKGQINEETRKTEEEMDAVPPVADADMDQRLRNKGL